MPALPLHQLVRPAHTALLLQEVQNGVVRPGGGLGALADAVAATGMLERLPTLTAAARRAGVPVLHCTASHLPGGFGRNRNARLFGAAASRVTLGGADTEATQPLAEVLGDGDIVLPRNHGLSPLSGTELDDLLRNEGVTTLVVTGVSLNVAIPNTVFDAVNRSYQVVLVADAVAGVPVDYGEAVVQNALRLLATLTTVEELAGIWSGA